MLKNFRNYNSDLASSNTLLAISGGVDSVVMGELFHRAGYSFAVAHCNFQLRETASDEDETFVQNLADRWEVPFHHIRFDTHKVAQEQKKSIQLVARDLRYNWFNTLMQHFDYQYIATAHHQNDSVETALYNFTKGCGIRGLHGILRKREQIIRPLLFAYKEEITAFAKTEKITFREDQSNASTKYARNLIRHKVIPSLQEINPQFIATAADNLRRLQETEALYEFALQHIFSQLVNVQSDGFNIDIIGLQKYPAPLTILHELLTDKGFSTAQVQQIYQATQQGQGQLFVTPTHHLVVNLKEIFVKKILSEENNLSKKINQRDKKISLGKNLELKIEVLDNIPSTLKTARTVALLDYDKLQFPLTLRHWETGDSFQPIGMAGRKQKLQDFFSNQKINRLERKKVWILCSGKDICWIVGQRSDERFKINTDTNKILRIELIKSHAD